MGSAPFAGLLKSHQTLREPLRGQQCREMDRRGSEVLKWPLQVHTAYTQQIWASDPSLPPFSSGTNDKTDMSTEMLGETLGGLSDSTPPLPPSSISHSGNSRTYIKDVRTKLKGKDLQQGARVRRRVERTKQVLKKEEKGKQKREFLF